MDELSTKPFAFQQRVADCRTLYLACGGRHHDYIQQEMRALGHETFNRRVLYARNERGRRVPGWPERFHWNDPLYAAQPPGHCGEACLDDRRTNMTSEPAERATEDGRHSLRRPFCERDVEAEPRRTADRQSRKTRLLTHDFVAWLRRVSPGMTWDRKFQQHVLEKLKRVTDGVCKRLMIFMPPRHGKSELVTQRYAAWRLKRDPKMRVVVASYNQKLANRFSRGIRRILSHDAAAGPQAGSLRAVHDKDNCSRCIAKAQECPNAAPPLQKPARSKGTVTPENALTPCGPPQQGTFRRINTESEWETQEGGGVRAVGVGAGITGFGADLVIIDDPVKGHAQAESPTMRENVWEWFNSDIYTRLEPDGAVILIQTRWHEDDLAGRLLREMQEDEDAEQWEVISLPALAEERSAERSADTPVRMVDASSATDGAKPYHAGGTGVADKSVRTPSDPLGRLPGEALWPERFDAEKLNKIKKRLGTYAFSALYQQTPVPADGGFFKRHWFKTIDHSPSGIRWKRGYDLGISARADSDFTATARVGFDHDGNMYIDRLLRKRMEYPEQRRTILRLINSESDTEHLIEESANGSAVIQDLRRDRNLLGRRFRGVRVTRSKTARALSWNALAEEGRVHLVRGPWNSEFLAEACSFPLGRHDDQIDAVSLAVEAHGGKRKALHFFN